VFGTWWRVTEDTLTLAGKRKRDPAFTLRRVSVHSTARAHAAVTARITTRSANVLPLTKSLGRLVVNGGASTCGNQQAAFKGPLK
jgi:hypothetical protein